MGSQTQFGTGTITKKSFLKAVGIASLAALFCVGCVEKGPDGEGTDGGGGKKDADSAYIITFDPDGGTVTPMSATTGTDGRLYDLPTPEKDCYSFIGWYTASTGGTQVTTSTAFNSSATIYARWTDGEPGEPEPPTQNTYTVKFIFITSGGGFDSTTISAEHGSKLTKPADIAREGYTFNGWYNGTAKWDFDNDVVTSDIRLYAEWTSFNTYIVTFDVNGGSGSVPSQTVDTGSYMTLPSGNSLTRPGYTFEGWYANSSGTGTNYSNNNSSQYWPLGNVTLYAKWKAVPFNPVETFVDSRDGKTYKNVKIGYQTWMAENLDYAIDGSKCFGEDGVVEVWDEASRGWLTKTLSTGEVQANCAKYGRLYNLSAAMKDASSSYKAPSGVQGVCPAGWHLPSVAEWNVLFDYVGGGNFAGTKLKSPDYWTSYSHVPKGTDDYGFSALPGGRGYSDDRFSGAGISGDWWTAQREKQSVAVLSSRYEGTGGGLSYAGSPPVEDGLLSVRCVQDCEGDGCNTSSWHWVGKGNDISNYKTVTIGTQTWMAENLDYNVEGSRCYKYSADSCAKYGRLYDWATAMDLDASYNNTTWGGSDVKRQGVCPVGWHLPSDAEWDTLMTAVGGSSTAGTKLKSSQYWSGVPGGTDEYGFSALPGGSGNSNGAFGGVGDNGNWWSSTDNDVNDDREAWGRNMRAYDGGYVGRGWWSKATLYSVRCVRDE